SNKEDSEYNKFLKKIKEITDFIADDKKELFILNCYLTQYRNNAINLARWFKRGIICLIMSIIILTLDIFNISSLSYVSYIIFIIFLIAISFILEAKYTKKQQMIDDKKKEYSKLKRLKNYLRTCFLKKSEFNDKMSKLSQEDYDIIEKEIKKVKEDLTHFPDFIERIDKIIENRYGKYSSQAHTLFKIQKRYFLRLIKDFNASVQINNLTELMREILIEIIKFLKTLKP
ncbi:MAG: hypothetical protein ACTSRP_25725, partial [Candidatus Helarchaeota archaeon]